MIAASAVATAVLASATACRRAPTPAPPAPSAVASARPPVDHLAPGELAESAQSVFGFAFPEGLKLLGAFPGVAEAAGPVSMEDLSNYIRAHVDQPRVELGAAGAVFPEVHVLGGDPTRVFRFQLSLVGPDTHLTIRDVTPKPAQPVEHVSNEEAWRRAGFKPNGTPLDLSQMR